MYWLENSPKYDPGILNCDNCAFKRLAKAVNLINVPIYLYHRKIA